MGAYDDMVKEMARQIAEHPGIKEPIRYRARVEQVRAAMKVKYRLKNGRIVKS